MSFPWIFSFFACLTNSSELDLWWDKRWSYSGYWKSLSRALRSVELFQLAIAWFSRSIKNLFDCRICIIRPINSCDWSSLIHCPLPASCSTIFCSPYAALKVESVYWVCEKGIWNGFPGAKNVSSSRGTTNYFTSSPRLHQHLSSLKGKRMTLETKSQQHDTMYFSTWRANPLHVEGIASRKLSLVWINLSLFPLANGSSSAINFDGSSSLLWS